MDMHIEDWNKSFLSKFSAKDYFESLKTARINSPMIYIQSHIGYCYWPTKTGKIHSSFIGREDEMRKLFNMCHNDGMSVIAYYSLIYNNWAYDNYPEWRMINAEGLGDRETGKRYGVCCPNNIDYRKFTKNQIKEFCEYFDFEGIFLDMTFWSVLCYCDKCKKRFLEETGKDIPKTVNWNDETWVAFQKARTAWLGEFATEMSNEIKKYKPDCDIEHQYAIVLYSWRLGVDQNIALASDYSGGDLYGGVAEHSFACKLFYNITMNQPFEYMTSRCNPNLCDHTTTKTKDALLQSVAMTYFHHGASLIIDAIDPCGTHDKRVYKLIGEIFEEVLAYEDFIKSGEQIYDAGIYFKLDGKMDLSDNGQYVLSDKVLNAPIPHLDACICISNSLRKHKIPYTVLNNFKTELLKKAKILILSDVPLMTNKEIDDIKEFVKAGGKLYLSGTTALPIIEEVFGLKFNGYTEGYISYISPTTLGEPLMKDFSNDYPLMMYSPSIIMDGETKGDVLGTITLPYTTPNPLNLFSRTKKSEHDPFVESDSNCYKFASIHSNPPGIKTNLPAIIKTNYGNGCVVWSCLPIEKADRPQHSDVFASIIRDLVDNDFAFYSNAPEEIEIIEFNSQQENQKTIGVLNTMQGDRILPIYDFEISVKSEKQPKSIICLPQNTLIPFVYDNGLVTFSVNKVHIHKMFIIKY